MCYICSIVQLHLAILTFRNYHRNVAFYSDIYYISSVRYFKTSTGKLGMLNRQITIFFS